MTCRGLAICTFVLAMSGCVAPTSAPVDGVDPARDAFVAQHVKRARAAEQGGEVATALYEWRMVRAADSGHAEARARIRALRRDIARRVSAAVATAEATDDPAIAQTAWLKVLALDGTNKKARAALQSATRAEAMAQQAKKDAERFARESEEVARTRSADLEGILAAHTDDPAGRLVAVDAFLRNAPDHSDARRAGASAALEIASAERKRGRLSQAQTYISRAESYGAGPDEALGSVKAALANDFYALGHKQRATDLLGAIASWETALALVPGHLRAQKDLERAEKILANLERIREN